MTGGSQSLAKACYNGARRAQGVDVQMLNAADAGAEHMLAADGYIFVFPENLAAISGGMKSFFDRCYYPCLGALNGRPYVMIICAGSDGRNAVAQAERIATGWRLRQILPSVIVCTHAQTQEAILAPKTIDSADLIAAEEMGEQIAVGLQMGVY
ncbi:NAD(P)H-dependent oxidoreductase [Sphingorhabdus sp.]|mgnify:FL=1|jgi:multimeric flavodoxin WrbA|nr:NAD(P)H-dependent oxidoreductase [uncultured Sphingorhabdus sp.]MCX7268647.1 NAD(P)H-dependent oxidoreductase [Sphingomonadales bacterium]